MRQQMRTEDENARLQIELAQLKRSMAAEGQATAQSTQLHAPLLAVAQTGVHADGLNSCAASTLTQLQGECTAAVVSRERAAVLTSDFVPVSGPVTSNSICCVVSGPEVTIEQAHVRQQLAGSSGADNAWTSGRALSILPSDVTIAASCIDRTCTQQPLTGDFSAENIATNSVDRQLTSNSDAVNVLMYDSARPSPAQQADSDRAVPDVFGLKTTQQQPIAGHGTANNLNVLAYDRVPQTVALLPPHADSVRALPATLRSTSVQQQLTGNSCIDNAILYDYALPTPVSDQTAASLQFGLPRASPSTSVISLSVSYFMPTVNTGDALFTVNNFQSLAVNDLYNTVKPLYTVPSVTAVLSTAMHSSHSSFSNMHAHQASSGAFLTHTPRGPMISFSLGTYPG